MEASAQRQKTRLLPRRMPAAKRMDAIIRAVGPLVAKRGIRCVTSRELAAAAEVSEGLIFKYFKTKANLHREIQEFYFKVHDPEPIEAEENDPEPGRLWRLSRVLMDTLSEESTRRLVVESLLQDGEYGWRFMAHHVERWLPDFQKAMREAKRKRKMTVSRMPDEAAFWYMQQLALAIHLSVPFPSSVAGHGMGSEAALTTAIFFCLRGMGVRDAAIPPIASAETLRRARQSGAPPLTGDGATPE